MDTLLNSDKVSKAMRVQRQAEDHDLGPGKKGSGLNYGANYGERQGSSPRFAIVCLDPFLSCSDSRLTLMDEVNCLLVFG